MPKSVKGNAVDPIIAEDGDLTSMKGHAIVAHDGSVKPETLVAAVKGVNDTKMGRQWYCTAEAMK
jgi:hypothetical protein